MTSPTPAERRKRLGQFFTGSRLATLLAELAEASKSATVLDPMAGSGDMLVAALGTGGGGTKLAAVEIDPVAAAALQNRQGLSGTNLEIGSAFDPARFDTLGWGWDLVITNPPYVRYQNSTGSRIGDLQVPTAAEVRERLRACLRRNSKLEAGARAVLLAAADEYSGLADLAVPSWLLCSSLVKQGGTLALVVPDTWLTRDYAQPVVKVLEVLFDLLVVVEDREASWFPEATVRTTLLVAQRRPIGKGSLVHRRVTVSRSAASTSSLVGAAFANSDHPDRDFAEWVHASGPTPTPPRHMLTREDRSGLTRRSSVRPGEVAPSELVAQMLSAEHEYTTLAQLGWSATQGLRTGANDFFYVRATDDGTYQSILTGSRELHIDNEHLVAAVRRQSDLRGGSALSVAERDLRWRVLRIVGAALPENAALAPQAYVELSGDLADLVRIGAEARRGTTRIPNLSAVRVNARPANPSAGLPPRFWYQLPDLAPRHRPDLLMARVNSGHPTAYANPGRRYVVDANFTTLVCDSDAGPTLEAMLAFLNTVWVAAHLESTSTVLGGGALKVEATHLRQLPVPVLGSDAWAKMHQVGERLLTETSPARALAAADRVLSDALGWEDEIEQLTAHAAKLLERRTPARPS